MWKNWGRRLFKKKAIINDEVTINPATFYSRHELTYLCRASILFRHCQAASQHHRQTFWKSLQAYPSRASTWESTDTCRCGRNVCTSGSRASTAFFVLVASSLPPPLLPTGIEDEWLKKPQLWGVLGSALCVPAFVTRWRWCTVRKHGFVLSVQGTVRN